MQINGINSTQSATNFTGLFNRKKKTENSYHTNPNNEGDTFSYQISKPTKSEASAIRARAAAIVMAAVMAFSPTAAKAAEKETAENNNVQTTVTETTPTSEFLSKISDEQWAEFSSEELLDLADALNGSSQDIDLDKIGDGSNVQINSGDINAEFGDDATLSWINGSENIAIDDSDVYDIYGEDSSSDCDGEGQDKNIQINEGDISGKFGDDATLSWINGSKNVAIDNSSVNGGQHQNLPFTDDDDKKQDATLPPQGPTSPVKGDDDDDGDSNKPKPSGGGDDGPDPKPTTKPQPTTDPQPTTKPQPTTDPNEYNNYWVTQAQISSNAWAALIDPENIADYTSEYLDTPLSGKADALAAYLAIIGASGKDGAPDNETDAKTFTETNANTFQRLYEASYEADTLMGLFGTDIDVEATGEAIRQYLDEIAPNKGDYKHDGDYTDDYKYQTNNQTGGIYVPNEKYEEGSGNIQQHEPLKPKTEEQILEEQKGTGETEGNQGTETGKTQEEIDAELQKEAQKKIDEAAKEEAAWKAKEAEAEAAAQAERDRAAAEAAEAERIQQEAAEQEAAWKAKEAEAEAAAQAERDRAAAEAAEAERIKQEAAEQQQTQQSTETGGETVTPEETETQQ